MAAKTATLTLHVESSFEEVLRATAQEEPRCTASIIERRILDYCERRGLPLKGSIKSKYQGDQAG